MKAEVQVRERLARMKINLEMWDELSGELVPTEPDPARRQEFREKLHVQIETLRWVLSE